MTSIQNPIFVIEGHDVGVYLKTQDAERHLESSHVEEGVYAGFDAVGHPLKLASDGRQVSIASDEAAAPDPATLESALRRYLVAVGEMSAGEPTCDLPCLVELSRRHAV